MWDLPEDGDFTSEERAIVEVLKGGPLSLERLAEAVGDSIYTLKLDRLEQLGIIMRSGLTPTDIMHITGDFTGWDTRAAHLGAEILARRLGMSLDELTHKVNTMIKSQLYLSVVKELMRRGNLEKTPTILDEGISPELEKVLLLGFKGTRRDSNPYISLDLSTDFSLVE